MTNKSDNSPHSWMESQEFFEDISTRESLNTFQTHPVGTKIRLNDPNNPKWNAVTGIITGIVVRPTGEISALVKLDHGFYADILPGVKAYTSEIVVAWDWIAVNNEEKP